MEYFTRQNTIDYLYNCFTKVDGLWFMKSEEISGFDFALMLDKKVWEILPKIQARFIKDTLLKKRRFRNANTAGLFIAALEIKLTLDRFKFSIDKKNGQVFLKIDECPWHNIMIKAKRENLSDKIGSSICSTEYRVFTAEFDPDIKIGMTEKICCGKSACRLDFKIF